MKLLALLLRSSWLGGVLSAILGAISGLISLTLITLIHATLSQRQANVSLAAVIFFGLCVVVMATQVAAKCLLVRLAQSSAARLRLQLCRRILDAPLRGLERVGHHRLLNTLISDVNSVIHALSGMPGLCAQAMVLIAGVGYLATMSIPLALCTVAVATAGVVSYLAGDRLAKRYLIRAREDQDELVKQLKAMTLGVKELKGNRQREQDFVRQVLIPTEREMRGNSIIGQCIQACAQSWGRLMLFIGIGLLLFVWPQMATVDAATLTGYTLTILYLTFPLDSIVAWLPALNNASIAYDKIEELGLQIAQEPALAVPTPKFDSIALLDVRYDYGDEQEDGFSLGPVNLVVHRQEVLFIAGGNGSGKTTLAKLLTGLYEPTGGSIELNGQVVTATHLHGYRQLFSTIFVEGNLFDRLLGVSLESEEVQRWCSLLGVQDKVDLQTGRLAIDELSRGQHKRLALLIACLDDRPIFVFDEWAAEQDPSFKEVFYHQILPELKQRDRTVVAITHDDRYFFAADRVVTLANGTIESFAGKKAA